MYIHRQKSPSSKQVFARKRLATTQSNEKIKYRKKREVIIRKAHRRRRDKGRITRWILRDQYFTGPLPARFRMQNAPFASVRRESPVASKRVRSREGEREDTWPDSTGGAMRGATTVEETGSERENTRYFTLPSW